MILVTGGSGLLGHSLVEMLLAKGLMVKAIYNKTALGIQHPNLHPFLCDILDVYALEDAMKAVTEVYHCAAVVSFSPKDEKLLYKVNVEGTANIVNAALAAGVRKLVHVSSVAALGRLRPGEMITEQMQWSEETNNSRYGYSKYLGELEVWRGVAEGLSAVVVNPALILGPGDWNDSSTKIFRSVYEGFPWYTEGMTGFVDVKDVAAAMIRLMEENISRERFIISAGNLTYREVFTLIANAFGKKPPHREVTPFLASLKWRLDAVKSRFTGITPLVTKETAASSMAKVNFDNSKLLKFLPQFQYRPLSQTIAETCTALQQKLNN